MELAEYVVNSIKGESTVAKTRVGINGFGRIGRCVLRAFAKDPAFASGEIEVVGINDLAPPETLAYLFKYDSVHGPFPGETALSGESLTVNNRKSKLIQQPDVMKLPWGDLGADIILECTGRFRTGAEAAQHLKSGARKVIISAPAKEPDLTIVMGVNDQAYDPKKHHVVSNASCTTNCLAPVAKVLHEQFRIANGLMTTIHSYTNDQQLLDLPHKDLRRARAAALAMIPTTTGAAKAVGLVLPDLKGKVDGLAIRVPTPNVSLVDFVCNVEKSATVDAINAGMKEAAQGPLKGILKYLDEPCVSVDFNGSSFSSIFDSQVTAVIGDRLVKVMAWYDNEMGFSHRMVDLTKKMGSTL